MQIPISWRRGQAKPWPSSPRINWAHPLARGLDFYCYFGAATGGGPIDLVSKARASFQGHDINVTSAYGAGQNTTYPSGVAGSGNKTVMVWPAGTGTPTSDGSGTGDFSLFEGAIPTDTGTPSAAPDHTGMSNSGGSNFAGLDWHIDSGGNVISQGCFTTGVPAEIEPMTGNSTSLFQSYNTNGIVRTGTGTNNCTGWQANFLGLFSASQSDSNVSVWDTTSGVYTTTFAWPGGITQTENILRTTMLWIGFWRRALTQTEIIQLHADPYCFLIFPEDELFSELVGATATVTGPRVIHKAKPWPGVPRVNWTHPLSAGLIGCWLPETLGFNLASVPARLTPGAFKWTSNADGGAFLSNTAATNCGFGGAAPTGFQFTSGLSMFWRGSPLGAVLDNFCNMMSITFTNADTAPFFAAALQCNPDWTTTQTLWNSGGALISTMPTFDFSPYYGQQVDMAGTFVVGGNTTQYHNGVKTGQVSFGASAPTYGTPQLTIGQYVAATPRCNNSQTSIALVYNRQLGPEEVFALHCNPYCLLVYPGDELFEMWVGITQAPTGPNFLSSLMPMMGVG